MSRHGQLAAIMSIATLLASHFAFAVQNGPVKLANTQLILLQQEQVCHIKQHNSSASAHSLKLPWPCQFHTKKDGKVRVIKRGQYDYLMVESSKKIANSRDCDTEMRSIRARADKWEISEYSNKVASCPPFQWNAVVFGELFAKP